MLMATLALALTACGGDSDDGDDTPTGSSLTISTTEMTFTAAGGTASFTVTGGTAYVKTDADWLTVVRTSGDSKRSEFSVTCEENTSTTERTSTILANLDGNSALINVTQIGKTVEPEVQYSFRTAAELAKNMYPGWNLGNTLEATGTGVAAETAWQSTKTTQQIIDYVKQQGFKSVRIPCSWYVHSTDGTIDEAWIARVKEVVDYCINDGLYVVLNDHWDNGWIEVEGFSESSSLYQKATATTITSKLSMLKTLWTQIAEAFSGYDEHLIFAGMNEPFQEYSLFNSHHADLTPILVRYNQAFVDAVRATEGNNAKRTLVVQGPAANIDSSCEDIFTMPTDGTQTGYIMAEVHYYDPWDFCGNESGTTYYWGSANHLSGSSHNASYGEESYVKSQMAKLKSKFYDNGYPVIIGEYGANWRDLSSLSGDDQTKHDASVKLWFQTVTQQAIANGCVPIAWDINSADQNGTKGVMTIINRSQLSVFCSPALEGIQQGAAAATWPD